MKRTLTTIIAATIAAGTLTAGMATSAAAQPRYDDRYSSDRDYRDYRGDRSDREYRHDNGRHNGWRKGGRIERRDWQRGHRIDYRRHHLRQPPRGYEWRQVDNNYVLAAVATGLIASIIIANQ